MGGIEWHLEVGEENASLFLEGKSGESVTLSQIHIESDGRQQKHLLRRDLTLEGGPACIDVTNEVVDLFQDYLAHGQPQHDPTSGEVSFSVSFSFGTHPTRTCAQIRPVQGGSCLIPRVKLDRLREHVYKTNGQ